MNANKILWWLPATKRATGRAAVAIAGLGMITGLAAGPAAAHATDNTKPVTVTAVAEQAGHADKAPVKAAGKAPKAEQLTPRTVTAEQQSFTPTPEQMRNVEHIVKAGEDMKLSPRAQVVAVATALQESKLNNYGHLGDRNDHDSLGLFQQRPTSGWGTPEQIQDPHYSATAFYEGLAQVDGWQDKPLTEAAQTVQVSAYPDAYAKWEKMAADLVLATHGTGPYADRR